MLDVKTNVLKMALRNERMVAQRIAYYVFLHKMAFSCIYSYFTLKKAAENKSGKYNFIAFYHTSDLK